MALKKADKDSHKTDYPDAYHRVGKWSYEGLYSAPCIKCTVFTYRSQSDADATDAAIADPEAGKPVEFGPINQRDYTFTLEDFGGKDKLTMAETYKLIKAQPEYVDAVDV